MNDNFFNNQSYILWKTEKKKLLWKFFVDRNFYVFLKVLNVLSKVVSSKIFVTIFYFVFMYFVRVSLSLNGLNAMTEYIYFWFFFWCILFIFYFMHEKSKWIKDIKDFLISRLRWKRLFFFKFLPLLIITLLLLPKDISFFLLVISIIIFPIFLSFINVINLLSLIVFILPYSILSSLFSFIYVYVLKWIKWYNFIKIKPEKNILKKYDIIENDNAENDIYKIKVRV